MPVCYGHGALRPGNFREMKVDIRKLIDGLSYVKGRPEMVEGLWIVQYESIHYNSGGVPDKLQYLRQAKSYAHFSIEELYIGTCLTQ
jgi:hypothetical protein